MVIEQRPPWGNAKSALLPAARGEFGCPASASYAAPDARRDVRPHPNDPTTTAPTNEDLAVMNGNKTVYPDFCSTTYRPSSSIFLSRTATSVGHAQGHFSAFDRAPAVSSALCCTSHEQKHDGEAEFLGPAERLTTYFSQQHSRYSRVSFPSTKQDRSDRNR